MIFNVMIEQHLFKTLQDRANMSTSITVYVKCNIYAKLIINLTTV